ncbi:hypothetical protein AB0F13_01420 [Streptomyces sp. NPDC026206]|uniref:hypothetical protein n=1 Tax=Streptomyces sp. NPDC026206 TaxID=3157089 RepID=UPI0033C3D887
MITLTETLAVDTVDEFLTNEEVARLSRAMDSFIQRTGWKPAYVGEELVVLPDEVQDALQAATLHHLPEIRRTFPSAMGCSPWQLIQFDAGEGAVHHLDGIGADPLTAPRHVARIGVTIQDAEAGGQFFFETTSSTDLWDPRFSEGTTPGYADGMRFTRIAPPRQDLPAGPGDRLDPRGPWHPLDHARRHGHRHRLRRPAHPRHHARHRRPLPQVHHRPHRRRLNHPSLPAAYRRRPGPGACNADG